MSRARGYWQSFPRSMVVFAERIAMNRCRRSGRGDCCVDAYYKRLLALLTFKDSDMFDVVFRRR